MRPTYTHNKQTATGRGIQNRVIALLGALLLLGLSGCSGPLWNFPGGALQGVETPLDKNALNPEGGVMALETNPEEPYSVNVGYVVINGNMFVDPTDSRTWYQNMAANPLVRIRFDGAATIHPATAVRESDPDVLASFDADRNVLRFEPR